LEQRFCLLAVFLCVVAQELGLDELRNAATMRPTPRPMPQTDTSTSTSAISSTDAAEASTSGSSGSNPSLRAISEDMAKQLDPEIELKRAMSEQAAWGGQAPAAAAAVAAAAPAAAGEGKAAAEPKQGKVSNRAHWLAARVGPHKHDDEEAVVLHDTVTLVAPVGPHQIQHVNGLLCSHLALP
jgi:hypothetical protein